MNYFFITGTSRGIGKALTEEILKARSAFVTGLSRENKFSHANYNHYFIDLNDLDSLSNFCFTKFADAESITLVNNAAIIGDINQIGKLDLTAISKVYHINLMAPLILMNGFINAYQNLKAKKLILNISSGAARHPVESWGLYCSSKSSIDMITKVASEEQKQYNDKISIRVLSVAPGIVDTNMQTVIRETTRDRFRMVDKFINYKKENQLVSPQETAKKLLKIINNPERFEKSILDVREIDL
ncbi:MAG: SDR family NAD(P)-dependent oxidoreductase [Bacteroidales bacterium]